MKIFMYLLPALLTMSCTGGKKFAGAANSAAADKPGETEGDSIPEGDGEPEPPTPAPTPVSDPYVAAIEVGVNFEDTPKATGGDADYNDAVLCFKGEFDVSKTEIVASKDQTFTPSYYSASGCLNHRLEVVITREGKAITTLDVNPKDKEQKALTFKKGDRLTVSLMPQDKECGGPGVKRLMTDPTYGLFVPNDCRKTGR